MLEPIRSILQGAAVLLWLGAIAHALVLLRHRVEGRSIFGFMVHGPAMFVPANFRASGWAIQRRMRVCCYACFACAFGVLAIAIAGVG
jgi:hypothetical protein